MNMHKNARMTPLGRERLVLEVVGGQRPEAVAKAAGICPRTARKWIARFKAEGRAGLMDRSSRPKRLYRPTPAAIVELSRSPAPATFYRQTDRCGPGRVASDCQPHLAASGIEQDA
jgi:transposase